MALSKRAPAPPGRLPWQGSKIPGAWFSLSGPCSSLASWKLFLGTATARIRQWGTGQGRSHPHQGFSQRKEMQNCLRTWRLQQASLPTCPTSGALCQLLPLTRSCPSLSPAGIPWLCTKDNMSCASSHPTRSAGLCGKQITRGVVDAGMPQSRRSHTHSLRLLCPLPCWSQPPSSTSAHQPVSHVTAISRACVDPPSLSEGSFPSPGTPP